MPDGLLNVLKVPGMTSGDAVAIARGILSRAFGQRVKTGHFGTLDPGGAGVLPMGLGRGVRLFDLARSRPKTYRAGFRFGVGTDTLDSYGRITETSDVIPKKDDLIAILPRFTGKIVQVPPRYSSVSMNGRRAYELARRGADFDLAPRPVEIYSIDFVREGEEGFVLDVSCSGGTYVRSLARDLAAALGTAGHVSFIIRTRCGSFDISSAVPLEELEKDPAGHVLPLSFVTDSLPRLDLSGKTAERVSNGVRTRIDDLPAGDFALYADGKLLGIAADDAGYLKIKTRLS